jgi:(4S)-4-hydroxy-5-phosphonooxypentane-2,3-dione isomerase
MTTKAFVKYIHVHVIPGAEGAFVKASHVIASQSRKEEGVTEFDLLQRIEDPTRFMLVEGFASAGAETAHRATAHYAAWRRAIDDLMADPRYTVKFVNR